MSNDAQRIKAQIATNNTVIQALTEDPKPSVAASEKRIRELNQENKGLRAELKSIKQK